VDDPNDPIFPVIVVIPCGAATVIPAPARIEKLEAVPYSIGVI
jgi:hypothetical protein